MEKKVYRIKGLAKEHLANKDFNKFMQEKKKKLMILRTEFEDGSQRFVLATDEPIGSIKQDVTKDVLFFIKQEKYKLIKKILHILEDFRLTKMDRYLLESDNLIVEEEAWEELLIKIQEVKGNSSQP